MDTKEIKEIFEHVDANKDGKISMAEFIEAVRLLTGEEGHGISSEYFREFDINSDRTLDLDEFIEFVSSTLN